MERRSEYYRVDLEIRKLFWKYHTEGLTNPQIASKSIGGRQWSEPTIKKWILIFRKLSAEDLFAAYYGNIPPLIRKKWEEYKLKTNSAEEIMKLRALIARKEPIEEITKQKLLEHFENLANLAEKWKRDMIIPEPSSVISEINGDKKEYLMEVGRGRWLTYTPLWYIKIEGSQVIKVKVSAELEDSMLFNALLTHLKAEGLCSDYEVGWKKEVKTYIGLCVQYRQDIELGEIPREVIITLRSLSDLTDKITKELDIVIHRRTFKGVCPICKDLISYT